MIVNYISRKHQIFFHTDIVFNLDCCCLMTLIMDYRKYGVILCFALLVLKSCPPPLFLILKKEGWVSVSYAYLKLVSVRKGWVKKGVRIVHPAGAKIRRKTFLTLII